MFIIYTSSCCNSCKKVREWMKKNELVFTEKNVLKNKPKKSEIKKLLELSNNGFFDVISKRSKYFATLKKKINKMSFNEAVEFIQLYPNILRRPIVVDYKKNIKVVGFSELEFEIFLNNFDISIEEDL